MNITDSVIEYVKANWELTIRDRNNSVDKGLMNIKKPYTVPCPTGCFRTFFYWDTYFTNLGLMLSGRVEQAENNLDAMKDFIGFLGYVPNGSEIINRTQPPLFTRGVYNLWKFKKDDMIIEKYIDFILKELFFFRLDRTTPCGLSAFKHTATKSYLDIFYNEMLDRLDLKEGDKELKRDRIELSSDFLSIAESGWDFNPRFITEESAFKASDFAHLDLNCLLYDAEKKAAEMLEKIGRIEEAKKYRRLASERKTLMDELMRDKETGIYYDYNFKNGTLSKTLSCASFYVYDVGISQDTEAAKKILAQLELPFGLSVCPYRGKDKYMQWDYPSMWPSNVFFAVCGLEKIGLHQDAKRIAEKYNDTVLKSFEKTGQLWEKYDATKGELAVCLEYETPPMLGWTAGTYLFLKQCFEKDAEISVETV